MATSPAFVPAWPTRLNLFLAQALRRFSAVWVPLLVAGFSLCAWLWWPHQYASDVTPTPLAFRVLPVGPSTAESLEQAQLATPLAPPVDHWNTQRSETPLWLWLDLPPDRLGQPLAVEFPSRHAVSIRCWDGQTLQVLGTGSHSSNEGDMSAQRSGFVLQTPSAPAHLLCQSAFVGPARVSAQLWIPGALAQATLEYHRNSGLLDGGMLVLAAFVLIFGLINRDVHYLLFASWLVINLRMAALSTGWDTQWLGHTIPFEWLVRLRPATLALYYVATFTLFMSLFRSELEKAGQAWLITVARWSCIPLLVLSVTLPYATFLPIIWAASGLGIAGLVVLLTQILLRTWSRVAFWYAASLTVTLFASLHEVAAAALGLQGAIGSFNSVTAALASSLLASLAIAELMREAQQQRLQAQSKLEQTYTAIPIGLFTLNAHGGFLSVNPALREMLRPQVVQEHTDHWSDYFGADSWHTLVDRTLAGEPTEMELNLPQPDGSVRRLWLTAMLSAGKIEGTLQDITEKALATQHLQFLANHDPLTKVLNRRGIEVALQQGLAGLALDRPLAVAYLDLDRFKLINDLYGHTAGDTVLQQVCERAKRPLTPYMHLGRVGGDEFLLVLENTPLHQAEAVCREMVRNLSQHPYQVGERAFHVRCSIGLIEVGLGSSSKDIVSAADRACREAKTQHQQGLVVYDKASRVFSEHEAEMHLVEHISNGEQIDGLFLEMQPIMSLRAPYASLNFEVLLRMRDEHGDRVPTDRLIRAGENAGRMGLIDRWVLTSTLDWLELNAHNLQANQFVCLNLSGASLNDERFKEDVYLMLDHHRTIASRICLEITESVALHDTGNTRLFIDRVRSFGAKVALDDFGAGYTSFSYLKDLPADILKIDGSFIVNMNRHPANIAIVEAIVSLAQNLGMKTIAEWAEDFETVETLAEIGVDYVQGFVVARPQPPADLLLATSSAAFIRDEVLNRYLGTLAVTDDLGHIDLVLGETTPNTPQPTK